MKELITRLFGKIETPLPPVLEEKLNLSINKLPPDNRTAITLHFIENIPCPQIARQLNWSLSKVNQKITRGITLLKAELNPAHFNLMETVTKGTTQRLLRK